MITHDSKPVVLCDLDDTVADLITEWLRRYNKDTGHSFTKADITKWDISKCVPAGEKIYEYIAKPGMFDCLQPLPGAVEALRELHEFCDVVILSRPSSHPTSAAEKIAWCHQHLPFVRHQNILLGARKDLVRGDFLIDDAPENLLQWSERNRLGYALGIEYPYNEHLSDRFMLFEGHHDTAKAWKTIVQWIREEVA